MTRRGCALSLEDKRPRMWLLEFHVDGGGSRRQVAVPTCAWLIGEALQSGQLQRTLVCLGLCRPCATRATQHRLEDIEVETSKCLIKVSPRAVAQLPQRPLLYANKAIDAVSQRRH